MKNNTERIENYLSNELSNTEREQFLKELENNVALQDELKLQQAVHQFIIGRTDIQEVGEDENLEQVSNKIEMAIDGLNASGAKNSEVRSFISEGLKDLMDSPEKDSRPSVYNDNRTMNWIGRNTFLWTIGAAAAAVLLIFLFIPGDDSTTGERLFNRYFNQLKPLSYAARGTSQSDLAFFEGISAFKNGAYTDALTSLAKTDDESIYNAEALFYLPLTYMALNDFHKAVEMFDTYLSNYSKHEIEAKWYLALCYVKSGEFRKAIPYLNDVSEVESIYKLPAEKLSNRAYRLLK
jgi:tetratricopeptide (TPR) repeat protein